MKTTSDALNTLIGELRKLSIADLINSINEVKIALHEVSPMRHNPVDCVIWVKSGEVKGNDYNPNCVAPSEMSLLSDSILEDGFTQPIVTHYDLAGYEIVDGFHRSRVGVENPTVYMMNYGYIPVTTINAETSDRDSRISSTIRHNKARGSHAINKMASITRELQRRNWTDAKIAKKLGMDAEEVCRLNQVSGLLELVADKEYSDSWGVENG